VEIASLGAEWTPSLRLARDLLLQPFAGLGGGFRADWVYVPAERRMPIAEASMAPVITVSAGLRLLGPALGRNGSRYGLEASLSFMAPMGADPGGLLGSRYHVSRPILVPSLALVAASP
jgi:hypothetical protein